jgi:hypothetical protein
VNNLPSLDVIVSSLSDQLRQRWERHTRYLRMSGAEQISQPVIKALAKGDPDGALYAVLDMRENGMASAELPQFDHVEIDPTGNTEQAIAKFVADLSALQANGPEENLPLLRTSIFGSPNPLTPEQAWEFLRKGEEKQQPISWERLHAGWDSSPQMAQTQIGALASLSFRDAAGKDHQFHAGPGSFLAGLWLWANSLHVRRHWPRSQAAWFLLTGEPPQLLPASALTQTGISPPLTSTISVTTLAYASDATVLNAFRQAQRQLLGRRRGALALPRHAMATFVDLEAERLGKRQWRELWEKWNSIAPREWRLNRSRRRYPTPSAMLDAYRREHASRVRAREEEDRFYRQLAEANAKAKLGATGRSASSNAPHGQS